MAFLFNKTLCDDLYRSEGEKCSSWKVRLRYLFFVPGFTYTFFMRHSAQSRNRLTKVFWSIFLQITKYITHIQIPSSTQIGNGLRIVHFGHIVVNPETKIGVNFNIFQGCLIGNSVGKHGGIPIIGDNVYMGANSVIIGGCHIGNDVLIAPGALINFDVPDNSIVIGNPGKIIPCESSPTEKYIVYPIKAE